MFSFLGKTNRSIAFRQTVEPYVINQTEVEENPEVSPISIDYKDRAVFDTKVVVNQLEINAQNEEIAAMQPEHTYNIERIEPVYQDVLTYTNYFGHLTSYDGEEFQTACANYLASL